jgi:hypothetical protein
VIVRVDEGKNMVQGRYESQNFKLFSTKSHTHLVVLCKIYFVFASFSLGFAGEEDDGRQRE